jgi:SAM-dependent methyltransferase
MKRRTPRCSVRFCVPRRPDDRKRPSPARRTDWQPVADWYDDHVGDDGNEYHREVVLPGVLKLLGDVEGRRILDVACGQGVLCRLLHERGAVPVGVDAAKALVDAARDRSPDGVTFHRHDVRDLAECEWLESGSFDAAACVLAIQNVHPIRPMLEAISNALVEGGRFVVAMTHPAFRGPKETHWGWDGDRGIQYRRVDRYLVPRKAPIVARPGADAARRYTWSFHRPVGYYVRALRNAGLLVDDLAEWPSHKTSQPGPRQKAENVARKEIPLFMAIRAIKVAGILDREG